MTAAMLVLEPIFEADLQPEQNAYRPERSALDAVNAGLRTAEIAALAGDRRGFVRLLRQHPARRVNEIGGSSHQRSARVAADQDVAGRRRWKKPTSGVANVERPGTKTWDAERRKGLRSHRYLSNLYMRRFILGWKVLGHEQRFQAKIVNYADDFVICCRRNAEQAMDAMRSIMRKLKLTVNEEKTHVCRVPDESFDFLGYTFWTLLLATDGWRVHQPNVRRRRRFRRSVAGSAK